MRLLSRECPYLRTPTLKVQEIFLKRFDTFQRWCIEMHTVYWRGDGPRALFWLWLPPLLFVFSLVCFRVLVPFLPFSCSRRCYSPLFLILNSTFFHNILLKALLLLFLNSFISSASVGPFFSSYCYLKSSFFILCRFSHVANSFSIYNSSSQATGMNQMDKSPALVELVV